MSVRYTPNLDYQEDFDKIEMHQNPRPSHTFNQSSFGQNDFRSA